MNCHDILNHDESERSIDITKKVERDIYWIATESVGKKRNVIKNYKDEALGGITLTIEDEETEFFEYWKNLKPKKNKRNIWFDKFWEKYHDCDSNMPDCRKKPPMTDILSKIHPTIQAVYAFAAALNNLQTAECKGRATVCQSMKDYDGQMFFEKYLTKVRSKREKRHVFDENGELAHPKYMVHQYQIERESNKKGYKKIGEWYDKKLNINSRTVKWTSKFEKDKISYITPNSSCPSSCEIGYGLKQLKGICCKGLCTPCEEYEFVDENFQCKDCNHYCKDGKCNGWMPSEDRKSCQVPQVGIFLPISMVLSAFGCISTLVCLITFIKYKATPVVRHSCFEHCIIAMVGMLILFVLPPLLEISMTQVSCTAFRFIVPLGMSMMYSALLVKINRMYRIFYLKIKEKKLMKLKQISLKPAYVDVKSQLIMIATLVGLSMFITIILIIYDKPQAVPVYPNRQNALLQKCTASSSTRLISHFYSVFLIITCTYYAILTRKIPDNFKETQNIGFAMYATCLIWMSALVIYFGISSESYHFKARLYGIVVSTSTIAVLACVFFPKIYIILFKPEENIKKPANIRDQLGTTDMRTSTLNSKPIASLSAEEDAQNESLCSKCNTIISEN